MAKVAVNSTGPPGQPDIAYTPDWEKYQARVERRRASEDLAQTLPDAFPARLDSTLAWDGATVAEHYDYAYHLTEADLGEIDGAVAHFKCKYSSYSSNISGVVLTGISTGKAPRRVEPANLPPARPACNSAGRVQRRS